MKPGDKKDGSLLVRVVWEASWIDWTSSEEKSSTPQA